MLFVAWGEVDAKSLGVQISAVSVYRQGLFGLDVGWQ